jgi:hypothetical protein
MFTNGVRCCKTFECLTNKCENIFIHKKDFFIRIVFFIFYFTAMLGLAYLLTVPGQQLPLQVLTDLRTNHADIAMSQFVHLDLQK